MKHRLVSCFLSLLPFFFVLFSGCGGNVKTTGNPGNPAQTTNLRVVNGNGGITSVSVLVNGTSAANNVTFQSQTPYTSVPAGQVQLTINGLLKPPNTSAPENLPANANNTLVISGCGTIPGGFTIFGNFSVITDDLTPPAPGNFKLRIVDGAIETAGFNLFVLPAGTPPSGTPTVSEMTMTQNSPTPYMSLAAGTYHIVVTQIGLNTILFDSGPIDFGAGQNRTYYIFQNGTPLSGTGFSCGVDFKPVLVADLN